MLDDQRRQAALSDSLVGWDLAFALNFTAANAAIVAGGETPIPLDYEDGTEGEVGYIKIEGFFGSGDRSNRHWKLVPGGSGGDIRMEMPNIEFTLTRQKQAGQPAEVTSFTNCKLTVSFELDFVDTNRKASNSATILDLKVKVDRSKGGNGTPVVTIEDFETTPDLGSDALVTEAALADWLEANFADFGHVFASININGTPDDPKFSWLVPTSVSYAVNDTEVGSDEDAAFIAILSMTLNRPKPETSVALSSILPAGEMAAIAISQELFMKNMLKAGIHVMFQEPETPGNWPDDYFDLDEGNTILTNTQDLILPQVKFAKQAAPVDVKVPARSMTVLNAGPYLDVQFVDFQHPYESVGIHLLDVFHSFRIVGEVHLNDENLLALRLTTDAGEEKLGFHVADAQKTETGQVVDWVIVGLDVAMLLFPFARAGWAKFAAEEPAPTPEGATMNAELTPEGPPTPAQEADVAAEGAEEVVAVANGADPTFQQFLSGYFIGLWGGIMSVMTGAVIFYDIYEGIADKNAKKNLPEAPEFGLRVLDPVAWPDAATPELTVTSVSLNDGLSFVFGPAE